MAGQEEAAAVLHKQLVGLSAQPPRPQSLSSLSSPAQRNGHCRVGGYEPMALWPQFPPCHAGLQTSHCCQPCPAAAHLAVSLLGQDGAKGGEQGWRSSPQLMSPHPEEPPLPAYPCSRGRAGQGSLQGSSLLAGCAPDPPAFGAVHVWMGAVVPGPCMCVVSWASFMVLLALSLLPAMPPVPAACGVVLV